MQLTVRPMEIRPERSGMTGSVFDDELTENVGEERVAKIFVVDWSSFRETSENTGEET